eukprot:gene8913-3805_t
MTPLDPLLESITTPVGDRILFVFETEMLDLLKEKVWDLVATAASNEGPPKLLPPLGSVDSSAVLQAMCRFPYRNVDGHHAFSGVPLATAPTDAWQCGVKLDGVACAEQPPQAHPSGSHLSTMIASANLASRTVVNARAAPVKVVTSVRRPNLRCSAVVTYKEPILDEATKTTKHIAPGGCEIEIVDEEAMLAESTFPIKCKDALSLLENKAMDAVLAEDFRFVAPVVGPLLKPEFVGALANFDIKTAFPDINQGFQAFRVDPFQPNRVWFVTRVKATHTGVLAGAIQPTGKVVTVAPQTMSMCFNEAGEVTQLTVGYCMDRTLGTTGAQPWKMSKRYKLFQLLGRFNSWLKSKK